VVLSMLNSRIIGFYSGAEPDHRGRYLHEIQQGADDKLEAVHDRMPVILDPDSYDLWLDPGMRDVSVVSDC
jgi:hypothetical protein